MLKLRSNLPTGALWSCPTLEIVQYGDEAHAVLERRYARHYRAASGIESGTKFNLFRQGIVT